MVRRRRLETWRQSGCPAPSAAPPISLPTACTSPHTAPRSPRCHACLLAAHEVVSLLCEVEVLVQRLGVDAGLQRLEGLGDLQLSGWGGVGLVGRGDMGNAVG